MTSDEVPASHRLQRARERLEIYGGVAAVIADHAVIQELLGAATDRAEAITALHEAPSGRRLAGSVAAW